MPFLAISVPNVTTRLLNTSSCDENREAREKCQRIIDYVFGNGPFPYSDITGINEIHKEHIAQILTDQEQNTQEDKHKDTDGKQQVENEEDETIRIETVVNSEDHPEIVMVREIKKVPSSKNPTDSLSHDQESHSGKIDDEKTKTSKEDFLKPTHYSEGQSTKINKDQKADLIQKYKSSTIIAQPMTFNLRQIKPLLTYHQENKDFKEKINTTDGEFLYEDSCGGEIYKEQRKRSKDKENFQNMTIKEFSGKNKENAPIQITEYEKYIKHSNIPNDQLSDFVNTTTEKQNEELLKPIMEKSDEIRLFDMPHDQPKVPSDEETTKTNVKCFSKTEPNSNEDFITKVGKLQSKRKLIRDDETIQMELFMPTTPTERSWDVYYKTQSKKNAKSNINERENENARNLPVPLICNIKPILQDNHENKVPDKITQNRNYEVEEMICIKEPSTDAVLIHCNKTTSIDTHKSFSEAIDKNTDALGKGTRVSVDTMNNKNKLNDQAVPVTYTAPPLPIEQTDISPTPCAMSAEQQKHKFFNISQQYPHQHAWNISTRYPVEMYSPKKFFIQNRPATPGPNEHVWTALNNRMSPTSHKQQKKMDTTLAENLAPAEEESSTVEHVSGSKLWSGDASITQQMVTCQIHKHNLDKKPDNSENPFTDTQPDSQLEPEPNRQPSISTKESTPLRLPNRIDVDIHYKPIEEEERKAEAINTQVKKQSEQWCTLKTMDDIRRPKSKMQNENQEQPLGCLLKEEVEPNDLKMDICSSEKLPMPEIKITNDMPLSKLMKAIRMRNQFLFIKDFLESVEMSKCGDKKPDCPPKAPVCCPDTAPAPPVQQAPPPPPPTPPPPCTPVPKKPKCPPKCKCKCKYVQVKDMFGILPRRISSSCKIDIPTADFEPFDQQEDVSVYTRNSVTFAGSFDPWVPIPNYPYPKKEHVPILQGCDPRCKEKKVSIYEKPKQKPCTGFPKRVSCSIKRPLLLDPTI